MFYYRRIKLLVLIRIIKKGFVEENEELDFEILLRF